jgi:hypothetical protein
MLVFVTNYGKHMRGVYILETSCHKCTLQKGTCKSYKQLFRHYVYVTVLTSMTVYTKTTGLSVDQLAFRGNLMEGISLIYAYSDHKVGGQCVVEHVIVQLRERDLICKVHTVGRKSLLQRRCVVCIRHGKRRCTKYCCPQCDSCV